MPSLKVTRRNFMRTTGAGLAAIPLAGLLPSCSDKTERPNFIVIQLDDLGWSDLGVHGNQVVETPYIDAFAAESVQCNQFYVNPVCAPTRAAFLTGRDFLRTGVSHVHGGKDFLHLDEVTIADLFKAGGYVTGMWGKWHSGHTDGYYPWERGFDQAYKAALYKHRNSHGLLNGNAVEHNEWCDDVIVDYAMDFITKCGDTPFFCYLSSLTCHEPLECPQTLQKKYEHKGVSGNLATLYGMIDYFDQQFGRLLEFLERGALEENTVVLFMSDNGPAINNRLFTNEDRQRRNVTDLKGHKGNIWENGVKSPLFIRWKGVLKPAVLNHLCDITDVLPTLLEMAGIESVAGQVHFDGKSFGSVLDGENEEWAAEKRSFNYSNPGWPPTDQPWSPEGVYDEYRPLTDSMKQGLNTAEQIISMRKGPYKLLLNPDTLKNKAALIEGYALYNILDDPLEKKNLLKEQPALAEDLKKDLHEWFGSIKASEHAFEMPVFLIGYQGKRQSTVWAKGPQKLSANLHNAFNYLTGWQNPGDWATYRIRVMTEGIYRLTLHHDSAAASRGRLSIELGGENRIIVIDDNQMVNCGEYPLEKGDHTMRLEVIEASSMDGMAVFDKLVSFSFILLTGN